MTISLALRSRVESDAKAGDYWSVPKGRSVKTANWSRIADHLKVLAEFQTVPWEEAQPLLVKALLDRKLIEPYRDHKTGFSAVARMQFPVWRLLGLAWINSKHVPEITEVGRLFIKAKTNDERRELLTMQLHRFQFYNPSAASHFAMFRTFPVLALYRLLSQTEWRLTKDEFALFGTRVRTFSDADDVAQLIDAWRGLTASEREQLLAAAKTIQALVRVKSEDRTTWSKVGRDLTYIESALAILPTLRVHGEGLEVPKAARRKVHGLVLASAAEAEFVEYESAQDWLAVYGQVPAKDRWSAPWARASEARTYYERIGRIDAATAAYAREEKGRSERAIEEYRRVQVLERVLEDVLEHNLDALEKGLKLVGRQYATAVGPIDLLAKDPNGIYVVIELKRGRSSDRVVGQIARYLTWTVQRLGHGRASQVRGIVVGQDFDKHFGAAIAQLKQVSPYTFDLRVLFERWPGSRDRLPSQIIQQDARASRAQRSLL